MSRGTSRSEGETRTDTDQVQRVGGAERRGVRSRKAAVAILRAGLRRRGVDDACARRCAGRGRDGQALHLDDRGDVGIADLPQAAPIVVEQVGQVLDVAEYRDARLAEERRNLLLQMKIDPRERTAAGDVLRRDRAAVVL